MFFTDKASLPSDTMFPDALPMQYSINIDIDSVPK